MSEHYSRSNQSIIEKPPLDPSLLREITLKLLAYCRQNDWAGYDPYDALNSRIFRALPFLDFKIVRLALTQAVKRSPINLRSLLKVPRTQNPKGIALFLSALVKLKKAGLADDDSTIKEMADRLLSLRSPENRYFAWGYSFDWQTRTYLVPKGSPNIICSTFAANALLDAYDSSRKTSWLDAAASAAEFILDTLFWREDASVGCFSYTPLERVQVHNANLLGAALLCRISRLSGEARFMEPALDAARFSVIRQHSDGSWDYGESPSQRWIDNFHTGYNLVALSRVREFARTTEFDAAIHRGLEFYMTRFFREDGAPKYYHNATYPIDIHSVAQSIITLAELEDLAAGGLELAHRVLLWALDNMWDTRGFFYFQKHPHFTVRTPFMRWSQAWMLFALSSLLGR